MRAKTIFFITILMIIMLFVFVQKNNKKSQPIFTSAAPPVISPIPIEAINIMDSPDGSMTLTLKNKVMSYLLFASSKSGGQPQQIFKKEEVNSSKLEIPYNTWSPDNVYVFLKEKTPTIDNYFVFQSSGSFFSNNLSYLSIQELFKKNVPDCTIEDVTGWGGINLIVINAKNIIDDRKVSFWFDVPSQSFIQLGTYFK